MGRGSGWNPWDELEGALASGRVVQGHVTELVKGGLRVRVAGLTGFVPASHAARHRHRNLRPFLGQQVDLVVLEVDPSRRNVVLSRRRALELQAASALAAVQLDQTLPGTVVHVDGSGALIDLGPIDGYLPRSEVAWFEDPAQPGPWLGQALNVTVLRRDDPRNRVIVSIRRLQRSPIEQFAADHAVGDVVIARLHRHQPDGLVVWLARGVPGYVPADEVPGASRVLKPGEEFAVRIVGFPTDRTPIQVTAQGLEGRSPSAVPDDPESVALTLGELVGWRLLHVPGDEIRRWVGAGWDPRAAKPWVEARFRDPDLARQWQASGIDTVRSRLWINAGFPLPAQALAWLRAGFTARIASDWLNAGFDPSGAAEWTALGIGPPEAAAWRALGVPASTAAEWRDASFGPEQAQPWLRAGGTVADARSWQAQGIPGEEAGEWLAAGFAIGEALDWRNHGIEAADAARWRSAGASAALAADWPATGIPGHEAVLWWTVGWPPEVAVPWWRAGIPASRAARWRDAGWPPAEAAGWDAIGWDETEAQPWSRAGFTPREAEAWYTAGFDASSATTWSTSRCSPAEAARWEDEGISATTAARWMEHLVSARVAISWLRAGLSPDEARQWSSAGFPPSDGAKWRKGGWSPNDAAAWHHRGWTEVEARPWHEAGFDEVSASQWWEVGITDPGRAEEWLAEKFDARSAAPWIGDGWHPEDARQWSLSGWAAGPAGEWYEEGWTDPAEAAEWRDEGWPAQLAGVACDAGLPPDLAHRPDQLRPPPGWDPDTSFGPKRAGEPIFGAPRTGAALARWLDRFDRRAGAAPVEAPMPPLARLLELASQPVPARLRAHDAAALINRLRISLGRHRWERVADWTLATAVPVLIEVTEANTKIQGEAPPAELVDDLHLPFPQVLVLLGARFALTERMQQALPGWDPGGCRGDLSYEPWLAALHRDGGAVWGVVLQAGPGGTGLGESVLWVVEVDGAHAVIPSIRSRSMLDTVVVNLAAGLCFGGWRTALGAPTRKRPSTASTAPLRSRQVDDVREVIIRPRNPGRPDRQPAPGWARQAHLRRGLAEGPDRTPRRLALQVVLDQPHLRQRERNSVGLAQGRLPPPGRPLRARCRQPRMTEPRPGRYCLAGLVMPGRLTWIQRGD